MVPENSILKVTLKQDLLSLVIWSLVSRAALKSLKAIPTIQNISLPHGWDHSWRVGPPPPPMELDPGLTHRGILGQFGLSFRREQACCCLSRDSPSKKDILENSTASKLHN